MTRNSWHSGDTQLTVIFWMRPWPHNFLFRQWWLAIRWSWITVRKSLTNYLIEKAKFCWGFIDADFQNGEVTLSLVLSTLKAANMMVTHNRKLIPFQSAYLHYQISLTLRWHAVEGGSNINTNHIANQGCETSTIHTGCSTILGLCNMQRQNVWLSLDGLMMRIFRCSEIDSNHILLKGGHYFDYW